MPAVIGRAPAASVAAAIPAAAATAADPAAAAAAEVSLVVLKLTVGSNGVIRVKLSSTEQKKVISTQRLTELTSKYAWLQITGRRKKESGSHLCTCSVCAAEIGSGKWALLGGGVRDENDILSHFHSKAHERAAESAALKLGAGSIKAGMAKVCLRAFATALSSLERL